MTNLMKQCIINERRNNMGALMIIETEAQLDNLINTTDRVLVDFYADWCGPCKMVGPMLEQLDDIVNKQITIVKVNVETLPELTKRYEVRNIPALLLFIKGQHKHTHKGSLTKQELIRFISND